jgi:protein transport protein SEC23
MWPSGYFHQDVALLQVAAVLIAKKTVLKAKSVRDLADMRASVDERLKDISQKFGNTVPKSKLRSFPASLAKLPELLFHLRRGPLLGSIIGHEDERAVYRSLYLQAGFDLSLRMMAPRLLMHRGAGTFEELPANDLALQSNAVIVLDHGTDFFIWTVSSHILYWMMQGSEILGFVWFWQRDLQ